MNDTDARERDWLLILLRAMSATHDNNPGRNQVTELGHCLQTADRAKQAGADDELILVALLHDAAKPLSLTSHGEAIAAILRSRISRRAYQLLRDHGEAQAHLVHNGQLNGHWPDDTRRLAEWDAASFDPSHPTPPLDTYLPLIDRLYTNEYAPLTPAATSAT